MRKETELATLGCNHEHRGVVNLPPYRASTILFPTLAEFELAERGEHPHPSYGRYGTPSTEALEETIATLEGADYAIVTSSGLAAIVLALTNFLKSGDHMLMVDSVYGPARRFCDLELKKYGVEVTYYDPLIGAGIASLMKSNTKVVYVESPGSLTFEVQDVPAIAKAAHAKGATVIGDNTWATPLYSKCFEIGIDVSIHSVTKYMAGHSDLVMGAVTYKKPHHDSIVRTYRNLGSTPGADNVYLAQRGLRTMGVRLKQQFENAMAVIEWLKKQPEIEAILFPALPGAPGHDLWKRDFKGACSLFAVALKPVSHNGLAAMLDHLEFFGMGYSWGGFESLITPFDPKKIRTASQWPYSGIGLRLHIGLEHPDDLIRDLDAGFKRLRAAK
jgi:cysteine-S-conjugate beta-lyase